ncbi:hypothetical protein N1851_009326 [Merluccius polli]|uniref:Uncharacterized protein n=1 Tax=Merluccius polli TaxID=89951 RepID=A0AA47P411_MERPO|nr:hypothetical protein N1851_009326 [Merluccius polli]
MWASSAFHLVLSQSVSACSPDCAGSASAHLDLKLWTREGEQGGIVLHEVSFNRKHTKAQAVIKRTFDVLKMRFRCLDNCPALANVPQAENQRRVYSGMNLGKLEFDVMAPLPFRTGYKLSPLRDPLPSSCPLLPPLQPGFYLPIGGPGAVEVSPPESPSTNDWHSSNGKSS